MQLKAVYEANIQNARSTEKVQFKATSYLTTEFTKHKCFPAVNEAELVGASNSTCHLQAMELNARCPCCWTTPVHDSQTRWMSPSLCLFHTSTTTAMHTKNNEDHTKYV